MKKIEKLNSVKNSLLLYCPITVSIDMITRWRENQKINKKIFSYMLQT